VLYTRKQELISIIVQKGLKKGGDLEGIGEDRIRMLRVHEGG